VLILPGISGHPLQWNHAHHWLMIPGVLVVFGAAGLIMRYLTPGPDLHSTDEVIRSYHGHPGDVDLMSYWPKMLAFVAVVDPRSLLYSQ
jgi:CIC family chloride channel protein